MISLLVIFLLPIIEKQIPSVKFELPVNYLQIIKILVQWFFLIRRKNTF